MFGLAANSMAHNVVLSCGDGLVRSRESRPESQSEETAGSSGE